MTLAPRRDPRDDARGQGRRGGDAMNLICGIAGHRRSRNRVWDDGLSFRASCTRCGSPLIRDEFAAGWRVYREQDHDERRSAKPAR